jgi:hypothetical protein
MVFSITYISLIIVIHIIIIVKSPENGKHKHFRMSVVKSLLTIFI